MNTTLSEILEKSFELKDRFVRTRTKAGGSKEDRDYRMADQSTGQNND